MALRLARLAGIVPRLHATPRSALIRSMFIQVRDTPNENSLMFLVSKVGVTVDG